MKIYRWFLILFDLNKSLYLKKQKYILLYKKELLLKIFQMYIFYYKKIVKILCNLNLNIENNKQ